MMKESQKKENEGRRKDGGWRKVEEMGEYLWNGRSGEMWKNRKNESEKERKWENWKRQNEGKDAGSIKEEERVNICEREKWRNVKKCKMWSRETKEA